jgi:hypothetical protein
MTTSYQMISRTCASASEGCAEAKSGGAAAAASDRGRVSRSTSSLDMNMLRCLRIAYSATAQTRTYVSCLSIPLRRLGERPRRHARSSIPQSASLPTLASPSIQPALNLIQTLPPSTCPPSPCFNGPLKRSALSCLVVESTEY